MAEGIGLLSGLTALALMGVLAFAFLRKCDLLSKDTSALLIKTALLCVCFSALYFLFGLLMRCIAYGPEAICPPWEIFSSPGLRDALDETGFGRNLLFLPGHGLGLLFSRNFAVGGMTASFLLSFLSVFLLLKAFSSLLGGKAAFRIAVLLLSLPGAFLCFLPGGLPYAVLLLACLALFLSRGKAPRAFAFPPFLWEGSLALSSLFSAAVMYLFSTGFFS